MLRLEHCHAGAKVARELLEENYNSLVARLKVQAAAERLQSPVLSYGFEFLGRERACWTHQSSLSLTASTQCFAHGAVLEIVG